MKYIKTYEEEFKQKYDIGDYIKLKRGKLYPFGLILDVRDEQYTYSYLVEFFTIDDKKIMELWFQEPNIERKATQEEKEYYIQKKTQLKYNL